MTDHLDRILADASRGLLPEGAYPIRSVAYDGVGIVTTDSGARRQTSGDHGDEPHWARVTNIPGRGPAWWRLVVGRTAYGVPLLTEEDKRELDSRATTARKGLR